MRFVVPDSTGRLAYHDECVISLKHLKERLSKNVVKACSRMLNKNDMVTIGCPSIEDIVEERRVCSQKNDTKTSTSSSPTTENEGEKERQKNQTGKSSSSTPPPIEISIEWTAKLRNSALLLASSCRMNPETVRSILSHTRIGFVETLHTRLYLKKDLGYHPIGTDCTKIIPKNTNNNNTNNTKTPKERKGKLLTKFI